MTAKPEQKYPLTPEVFAALEVTKRGCDELLVEADWIQKLAKSQATGTPLRIKLGLDPTAPDKRSRLPGLATCMSHQGTLGNTYQQLEFSSLMNNFTNLHAPFMYRDRTYCI